MTILTVYISMTLSDGFLCIAQSVPQVVGIVPVPR